MALNAPFAEKRRSRSAINPQEDVAQYDTLDLSRVPTEPSDPPPDDTPPLSPPSRCAVLDLSVFLLSPHGAPREFSSPDPLQGFSTPRKRNPSCVLMSPRYRHHAYFGQLLPLLELVTQPDSYVLNCIHEMESAGILEKKEFVKPVMGVIHCTGGSLAFLIDRVEREVEGTVEYTTLFRGNSTTVQYLSTFCFDVGRPYLNQVLLPLVMLILDQDGCCEMDPLRVSNESELKLNSLNLMVVCRNAFEHIKSTMYLFPAALRILCNRITRLVEKKFEGKGLLAVGAIMFLRIICAALVTPETFGFVPFGREIDGKGRRRLVLVSKVLQTLANLDARFGEKEQYMVPLNVFLRNFHGDMQSLLKTMTTIPDDVEQMNWPNMRSKDVYGLHCMFWTHRDEFQAKFASAPQKVKNVFDDFLVEVGEPMSQSQFLALEAAKHEEMSVTSVIDRLDRKAIRKQQKKLTKGKRH